MGQVNDTIITQGKVGREVLNSQIYDDHGDPYHAALEDASGNTTISFQAWAAVFFLGLSLTSCINFPLNIFVAASSTVAKEMQGNVNNLNWIAGGWYLSGSIAFAIGGQLSDYFGRKGVVLAGQALLLVGHLLPLRQSISLSRVMPSQAFRATDTCLGRYPNRAVYV